MTGDDGGRVIETCGVLESVASEIVTFSSSEAECAATLEVEEASCGAERVCEEEDALWESGQP